MDEQGKYTSFAIPQRDTSEPGSAAPYKKSDSSDEVSLSHSRFAEIEIDFSSSHESAAERALRFFSSVTPPEPVKQKQLDPLRLKFYEMRRLASGRPFARDDSELFYKQAKFMVDFTDDYPGDTKFFMYYPYYQHMGYEQLRTYFTWRTNARNGEMPQTSVSYVFLYVYELLNNIGLENPCEGLEKLLSVWKTCLEFSPALENYMPQWFKDYHVYYGIKNNFADFAKEHGLLRYYPTAFLFDDDFDNSYDIWTGISAYEVTKSKFVSEGNELLFKDCFRAVLDGIRRLCEDNNFRIEDLFVYGTGRKMPWQPFKQALFLHNRISDDCTVEMPGREFYYCKNNRWSVKLPIYFSTQKEFVGYIVKKTEACLRQAVKYKYKLTAEPKARFDSTFGELKRFGDQGVCLEKAIEKSVSEFHRSLTRTVVTVDHANLARIREEAQGTQEKLIVLDDNKECGVWSVECGVAFQTDAEPNENAEFGISFKADVEPSVSGSASERTSNGAERMPEPAMAERRGVCEDDVRDDDDDGWGALKGALDAVEIGALEMILRGETDMKAFSDENGIMLEVLADSINEKAADLIGDSILETGDGMAIYDEYRESLTALLHTV